MNSLLSIFAAPTALSAVDSIKQTAKAAASPFDDLLRSALGIVEQSADAAPNAGANQPASLRGRVAEELGQLFESLGLPAGEQVTLSVDDWTGDITVEGYHAQAAEIEDAISTRGALAEAIRQLGATEGRFDGSPFKSKSQLRVTHTSEAGAAEMAWL